jgi:AmmeMemoRadiSam system protein B
MIRQSVVAGSFYPSNSATLRRDIESYTAPRAATVKALACLVPHAGYMYSGGVAGAVYAAIDLPRQFTILAPDHYGRGAQMAFHPATAWATPLGPALVDAQLTARIQAACPVIEVDERGHAEHSLEVQLPFLQCLCPEFTFAPIAIATGAYDILINLGEALAVVSPPLIVASSDLNHYENDRVTRRKDQIAIDAMLALDTRALFTALKRDRISMCGYGPAIAAITAAKRLGATRGELIAYATSGDAAGAISGGRDRVVGYAGMVFVK